VLWLRSFGIDISCVEIRPYRLPDGQLALVPRTIIPLPEAKDFIVRVEQKQVAKVQRAKQNATQDRLWEMIANQFNSLKLQWQIRPRATGNYLPIPIGHSEIHYEWLPLKTKGVMRVALHFEAEDVALNKTRVEQIALHREEIAKGVTYPFSAGMWGKSWASAEFQLPWDLTVPAESLVPEAVRVMRILIERTWQLVVQMRGDGSSAIAQSSLLPSPSLG
jgi:hypothetical protein